MSAPRMCDVCEKLAPSGPTNELTRSSTLPVGWQHVSLGDGISLMRGGEVCSQACATVWIDRRWSV